MSGLRTLSKVCKEYATAFDVTFNSNRKPVAVFNGISVYVQVVDMCDSATHLGHFISSTEKKSIVKSPKSCFWRSFNMCMSYHH